MKLNLSYSARVILANTRFNAKTSWRSASFEGGSAHRSGMHNIHLRSFTSTQPKLSWRHTDLMLDLDTLIAHGRFDQTDNELRRADFRIELARDGAQAFLAHVVEVLRFIHENAGDEALALSALSELIEALDQVHQAPASGLISDARDV